MSAEHKAGSAKFKFNAALSTTNDHYQGKLDGLKHLAEAVAEPAKDVDRMD